MASIMIDALPVIFALNFWAQKRGADAVAQQAFTRFNGNQGPASELHLFVAMSNKAAIYNGCLQMTLWLGAFLIALNHEGMG